MTTENTLVFQGRIISVGLEQCLLPNGRKVTLEIIRHPGGAGVVAVDKEQRVCLVYQFRHAMGGWIWEIPAGKIDNQEPPLVTAQKELAEEAGTVAKNWQSLGMSYSSPGIFTEIVYLYLATNLEPCAQALGLDEVLEVHWIPLIEALEWAMTGKISDSKTLIGLFKAAAILHIPLIANL